MRIDYLHAVGRRTLETVCSHLHMGTAAFYLGAGVDRALAIDAGQENRGLTWETLLTALKPFPFASQPEMEAYAKKWPTETALLARLRLGEQHFKEMITEAADQGFEPDMSKPFTKTLSTLLLKANVIVTPNFTSHVLKSLQTLIQTLKLDKEIIVLTREDLASFQFPTSQMNPHRIFLIHIHGRCVERSNLVFDAWGYNIAVNDDPFYHKFLNDLFSYRSVIGIGTSWEDIPIRNQAALVFRTQGYQRASHISLNFYPNKEKLKEDLQPNSAAREWANAMHAAYGVRMIFVDQDRQYDIVKCLTTPEVSQPSNFDDLAQVANFLDQCGDYESPSQQQWLLNLGLPRSVSNTKRIQDSVQRLYEAVIKALKNDVESWETVARIERHLRHFHYLYVAPFYDQNRNSDHLTLWQSLAKSLNPTIWGNINEELRFGFLVGQYELPVQRPRMQRFKIENTLYQRRLSLAKNVWTGDNANNLVDSALALLDIGWESISAKLFLDAAMEQARTTASKPDPRTARNIVDLAGRGRDVARSTGYFRREAKAQTLIAMWLPDPQESRIRILSKIRAAEHHSNGQVSALVEPAMISGLTAGLLASHIRTLGLYFSGADAMDRKLADSVEPLLQEAGIHWDDVHEKLLRYWENVIEGDLKSYFIKAIRGEYRLSQK